MQGRNWCYILHATLAERRRHEVSREQEAREQYQWNSVPASGVGARTKTAPPDAPRFAYVYSVFEVFRPGAGSGNARDWDTRKPRMDNVTLRYGTERIRESWNEACTCMYMLSYKCNMMHAVPK